MRTPSLPHPVVPRRATPLAAGAATVAVAVLLAAGCTGAPAGTATSSATSVPPVPSVSANAIASPAAGTPVAPAPTGTMPGTATPGGATEPTASPSASQAPHPTAPPPTTRPPTPQPTHRPTQPPTPRTTPPPTPRPTPHPTAAPATLGTIEGLAHAGPTCPVARIPPDPACADKPVAGLAIVVTDDAGATAATVMTDANGRFSVTLPPGTYTLAPQSREGLMRTPGPETVSLGAGATVAVDFAFDTGIR